MSAVDYLDEEALNILRQGREEARLCASHIIGSEHLLAALAKLHGSQEVYEAVMADVQQGQSPDPLNHLPNLFSSDSNRACDYALREALQHGATRVTPEYLLLGILRQRDGRGAKILLDRGAELRDLRQAVQAGRSKSA